jgi:EAL domain-containing protein (putative c-di-GMP-specific phosphodiesterase class I)/ActR/RegA family two-component response regulator
VVTAKKILIIDDDRDIGTFLREVAEKIGCDAIATDNPDAFWHQFDVIKPVVIFIDLKMPNVDGIELLRKLAERKTKAQVVMMSGTDRRVLRTALRLGKDRGLRMLGTLQKPIRVSDIQELLRVGLSSGPLHESDLLQAIKEKRIVVHYQPKMNLSADGVDVIAASEALARWDHPERGIIMPDKFIPLAERTGLIGPLTELVFNETLKQLGSWQTQGLTLSASVNISPLLLKDLDLPDVLYELCRSSQIDTSLLTLEITESGAMSDVSLTMDILTRLRLKGFGLSLDDFGTGYSSLIQLHRMPFSEMKIDKSFVIESDGNAEAVKIIRSIASLAESLELSLCAEGVESEAALALVRKVGCQSAQGYLIGKPMPGEAFSAFLQSRQSVP